ncbi:MAG TPA: hypothetical protein VGQ27_07655 [Steroidobacteraceae bacterium]|jgi:hypothetical protein|nr:hypothetical protein [Steroidobacteraceae bacterium]
MKHPWMAAALLAASVVALAGDDIPWTFNSPPGEGYAIKLVSADPAPGTPLLRGASVTIKVTAQYTMSVAKEGSVFLVIQDDKDKHVDATRQPEKIDATNAGGTVELSATLKEVPKAKEVRIFVPLMPKGLNETTGEIVIRYPIKKK